MKNPTMLYAHPGPHEIHGDMFDHIVVEEDQVDDAIKKGWRLTTPEAKEYHEAATKEAPKKRGRPAKKE